MEIDLYIEQIGLLTLLDIKFVTRIIKISSKYCKIFIVNSIRFKCQLLFLYYVSSTKKKKILVRAIKLMMFLLLQNKQFGCTSIVSTMHLKNEQQFLLQKIIKSVSEAKNDTTDQ